MSSFDIVAVGECLIDFVTVKPKNPLSIALEGNAGGAPANVLAAAAKLGRKTAFIGRVGRDPFGAFLKTRIAEAGVDISALQAGDEPTTLAMVSLDETGNRSFTFYRNQTADVMLREDTLDLDKITGCRVFHFGSVSMTAEPARTATLAAATAARAAGVKVSFDPNYRSFLWAREADAVAAMKRGVELADYVKVSDEEAAMLTGESDPEKAALSLSTQYSLGFVAVTLGAAGCVGISPSARVRLATFDVPSVDTTGAGDAFWGAALHCLLAREDGAPLAETELANLLRYANAAGSLATTRYGAIPAMADDAAIRALVKTGKLLG